MSNLFLFSISVGTVSGAETQQIFTQTSKPVIILFSIYSLHCRLIKQMEFCQMSMTMVISYLQMIKVFVFLNFLFILSIIYYASLVYQIYLDISQIIIICIIKECVTLN